MLEEMQVTTGGADVIAADRRRRHQPRDQERHRSLQGHRPLPRHRRIVPGRQHHRRTARAGRRLRRADPEHQGLRLRRRRPDQEGQGLVLGQLRHAGHQGRRRRLLQEHADLPSRRRRSTRARPTPRLLRSCLETDLTTLNNYNWKITCGAVQEQPLQLPEHLGGEGPQRARRVATCARSRPPTARRPCRSDFGTFGWLTGPVAVLEGRRSARDQRPLAGRRDVGAPRQQLRARLPRGRAARRAAARSRRRPARGAVRSRRRRSCVRPTASTYVSNYFLPATARRRPRVQVRLPLAQRALDEPQPPRRLHRCALHQRRRRTRPTSGATATPMSHLDTRRSTCRTRYTREPPHAEPRPALRHPGRRGAGGRVPANPILPDA